MALSNPLSVKYHLLSFIFLLVFLCYLKEAHVYAARGVDKSYHVVSVGSLEPKPYCTGTTGGSTVGSQKLKVINRYGPCSPIGQGKKVPSPAEIPTHDKISVHSINGKTSYLNSTEQESKASLPALDSTKGGNNFVVTVGFGTPKHDYTLIFDTGSDTTWMQCQPCSPPKCYKQTEPLFDPSLSSTYHNGSCKSSTTDIYFQSYADGSKSSGFLGCDTLTLEPSDVIKNFEFGCGQDNSPDFGEAAGILGLGNGEQSLISQTAWKFGKSFSYCLPTLPSSTGYLLFGKHTKKSSSSSLKFTPLLPNPDYPSNYFVELVGITVGTKNLEVTPSLFSSPGTILDSGTVITRLPAFAYFALRSAFNESMSQYPSAPPHEILDTCYDFSEHKKVTCPKIVFHFGGGTDVSLDPSGIVSRGRSKDQFCLAFAAKKPSDVTIIGNTQQQGLHVLYDLEGRRIGFGPTSCA